MYFVLNKTTFMYKLITNLPKTVGNMSDNTPLKLLALQKRSKCISSQNKAIEVKIEPGADPNPSTTSPYFSPRRTRNKIKIEYDEKPLLVLNAANKAPAPLRLNLLKQKKLGPTTSIETKAGLLSVKLEKRKSDSEPSCSTSAIQSDGVDQKESLSPSKQTKWVPPNWQQTLENIKVMREKFDAPVDVMGCHKCHDPNADEKTQRFHILVALMLSSQTKDNVTYEAMLRLRSNGLTPRSLVECELGDLEQKLYPVSFYKNKAKYLKKTSQILIDEFDSDIPNTIAGLMKLPGVGPKMGHICMHSAWKTVTGIGVDTHVHRISNRLKWTPKPTADPEKTRIGLEQWLPVDLWPDVNTLLVGFGQTICTPLNPKCNTCVNADICPSRGVKK